VIGLHYNKLEQSSDLDTGATANPSERLTGTSLFNKRHIGGKGANPSLSPFPTRHIEITVPIRTVPE
jgi:hypothetical protein